VALTDGLGLEKGGQHRQYAAWAAVAVGLTVKRKVPSL
jgi:hypothetical protein